MTKQLCQTGCGRPSPHGFVCSTCIDHTSAALNRLTPDDLYEILLIARGEAQPANRNLIHSRAHTPQDVLNLVVYSLFRELTYTWPNALEHVHNNQDAPKLLADIRDGVVAANELIYEQPEQTRSNDYLKARMNQIELQGPADMVTWMRDHLGIRVTRGQIDNWQYRGIIRPAKTTQKHVYYHPADVLRALDSRERQRDPQHAAPQ